MNSERKSTVSERPPFILYRCPNGHASITEFNKKMAVYFGMDTKVCHECLKAQARKAHVGMAPVLMTKAIGEEYYAAFRLGGIDAVKRMLREELASG